jgi:Flp pilus assembly protein TadD
MIVVIILSQFTLINSENMKKIFLILATLALCSCAATSKKVVYSKAAIAESAEDADSADKAFSSGNYAKAANLYKELLDLDDKNTDNLFKYAESLRLGGDTKSALKNYDKVLQLDPSALHALEGKSLCFVQDGEFKKAAVLLGEIVNKDATRWRVLNALGVVYAITGHAKESMDYYEMALQVSNNNPSVMNNMGLSVAFGGDLERGRKIIERSLDYVDKDDVKKMESIDYNLALIYGMSGKMDEAEKILNKYLPKAAVMNNLGFYAKLTNNDKLARTYLGKALASSPVHYEKAWNNLQDISGAPVKK